MQLVQRLWEIPVAVRIIISGTPIQNNLMEMHALFDFACEVSIYLSDFIATIPKEYTGRDLQAIS